MEYIFTKTILDYYNIESIDVDKFISKDFIILEDRFKSIGLKITKINISNIKNDNNKNYICEIKIDNKYQWVLIERNKNTIKIINSVNEDIPIDNFLEMDIVNLYSIKKTRKNILNDFTFKKLLTKLSVNYFLINLIADILIFVLAFIGNYYLKIIMDKIVPNNDLSSLIVVSITFISIFCLQIFTESIFNIYKINKSNQLAFELYEKLINKNYKNYNGYKNLLDDCKYLPIYIKKTIFGLPSMVSSVIITLIILVINSVSNPILSLLTLLSIVVSTIFNYIKFKNNEIWSPIIINNDNILNTKLHDFNNFSYWKRNNTKFNDYKSNIIKQIDYNNNQANMFFIKNKKIDLWASFFKKFTLFITIIISFYILVIKKNEPFSSIIFYMSILEIINMHCEDIFSFFIDLTNYKDSKKHILNIINTSNNIESPIENKISKISINLLDNKYFKCDKIHINNDTVIFGKNGSGKTTLMKYLFNPNNLKNITALWNKEKIMLNIENVIYQTSTPNYSNLDWSKHVLNQNINLIEIMKEMGIQNFDIEQMSAGEKQIMCFLYLLNEKNKIIILDEVLSNVETKNKIKLLKLTKDIITKNNFLIMISHDNSIHKLFNNKVNINEWI